MGFTYFSVQHPRYSINSKALKKLWNSGILNSYSTINKVGIDEDSTTLAVNAFLELREIVGNSPRYLHVCATTNGFDRAVFLEATGLKPETVKFYPYGESSAVQTIQASAENPRHAFLIVDSVKGRDEITDAYCSAVAIAGYSEGDQGIELVNQINLDPFRANKARLDSQDFSPDLEKDLIANISKESVKWSDSLIFTNAADLRGLTRKVPTAFVEGQKKTGFTGIASGATSFIYWIMDNFDEGQSLVLMSMDEGGGMAVEFEAKEKPTVLINSPSMELDVSTYMVRRNFEKGNISIPQGAYISSAVYFAQKDARYRLQTAKCINCNTIHFPPRRICKECGKATKPSEPLPRKGKLYTYTQILKGAAPTEFDLQQRLEGEYCVGIVEFEAGPKVISQLTDVSIDELDIGDEMKMVFRKIYHQDETDRYGYKFTKA